MKMSNERLEEIKNFKNADFTDCPVLTETDLSKMRPSHLVNANMWKPKKVVLNIRIDADILETLKTSGTGWQTRVNDYLRIGISRGLL